MDSWISSKFLNFTGDMGLKTWPDLVTWTLPGVDRNPGQVTDSDSINMLRITARNIETIASQITAKMPDMDEPSNHRTEAMVIKRLTRFHPAYSRMAPW